MRPVVSRWSPLTHTSHCMTTSSHSINSSSHTDENESKPCHAPQGSFMLDAIPVTTLPISGLGDQFIVNVLFEPKEFAVCIVCGR